MRHIHIVTTLAIMAVLIAASYSRGGSSGAVGTDDGVWNLTYTVRAGAGIRTTVRIIILTYQLAPAGHRRTLPSPSMIAWRTQRSGSLARVRRAISPVGKKRTVLPVKINPTGRSVAPAV